MRNDSVSLRALADDGRAITSGVKRITRIATLHCRVRNDDVDGLWTAAVAAAGTDEDGWHGLLQFMIQ